MLTKLQSTEGNRTKEKTAVTEHNIQSLSGIDLIVKIYNNATPDYCLSTAFRSDGYSVLLITKGKIKIKINFVEHTFSPRDILFAFPDSIYEVAQDPDASWICTYFNRDYVSKKGIFLNTLESYKAFQEQGLVKFSLSKSEYNNLYYDMITLHNKLGIPKETRHINDIVHNSFLSVIYNLFLLNEKRHRPLMLIDSKVELTNRFLVLVADRFKKEKRVTYYAGCLHITPRHLSQVVKQVTGITAGEHIDDFVIREAKLLLAGHIMNISEIAEELRFSNSSFFGKYFKKHTGVSPLSFKHENNIAF